LAHQIADTDPQSSVHVPAALLGRDSDGITVAKLSARPEFVPRDVREQSQSLARIPPRVVVFELARIIHEVSGRTE